MNNIETPSVSVKSLVFASLCAVFLALVILITAVLPAEYGIDPTGLGKKMGLTALSPAASSEAQTLATVIPLDPEQSAKVTCPDQTGDQPKWQDSVKIIVPAGDGLEYKFYLAKGELLEYTWNTDGGKLYFDFHGEPAGDKTGYFKSFKESTDNRSSGSLTTPFEGSHGWYWENKSRSPVTVILNTKGTYRVLGLM